MLKKMTAFILSATVGVVSNFAIAPISPAYAQSAEQSCSRYATDYANSRDNKGVDMVGGAVVGAIGGALIGSLAGNKKIDDGALIGAGVGAVGGTANNSKKWNKRYNRAYNDCLARSYQRPSPAPVVIMAPAPGTPDWYDYCRAKYRSFNSRTGLYLSYDGQYKPCQ